jgi:hypothetical protein
MERVKNILSVSKILWSGVFCSKTLTSLGDNAHSNWGVEAGSSTGISSGSMISGTLVLDSKKADIGRQDKNSKSVTNETTFILFSQSIIP